MEIKKFSNGDSIEELTSLLHASYKRLADMGLKFVATYQTAEYTKNFIKNGECFIIKNNGGRISATVMYYNSPFMKEEDTPEWYLKNNVASLENLPCIRITNARV